MIHLDQSKLQSMYPPISEEFNARMGQMIHALPTPKEDTQVKKASLRLLLIAALIVMALSTTAIALTRPAILDWLLGAMGAGSAELESITQEVRAEASADGITARITSVVYDGRQLALSYEVENADLSLPVAVRLNSTLTLNGASVAIPHHQQDRNGQLVPSPHLDVLPVRRNPVQGGSWCSALPDGLSGMVQGEITFIVYHPEKAFAYLISPDSMLADTTIEDADVLAEIADVRATLEGFANTVIVEGDDPEAYAAQGYTVIGSSPVYEVTDAHSHLMEAARITVSFTFDADAVIAHDLSGAQAEFADFTAYAAAFRLTPLKTDVDVRLIPRENTQAAAAALADRCGPCALTNETGKPVEYSDMDYCCSLWPYVTCMDGQWLCRYLLDMPGLLTFPESVVFTVQTGELFRFDLTDK